MIWKNEIKHNISSWQTIGECFHLVNDWFAAYGFRYVLYIYLFIPILFFCRVLLFPSFPIYSGWVLLVLVLFFQFNLFILLCCRNGRDSKMADWTMSWHWRISVTTGFRARHTHIQNLKKLLKTETEGKERKKNKKQKTKQNIINISFENQTKFSESLSLLCFFFFFPYYDCHSDFLRFFSN